MSLDLGTVISRAFAITWHHRWLWLLGVFGGGGVTFSFGERLTAGSFDSNKVGPFIFGHLPLLVAIVIVLAVIGVISFLVYCVAVPAATWAGLQLDAGHQVGLRETWREGRRMFWRYLRLVLLKALLGSAMLAAVGVLAGLGALIYTAGGPVTLLVLVPLGIVLIVLLVAAVSVLSVGLLWSDRLLVILGLGAVDSIRVSWRLFRRNKLNTVVLAVALYVFNLVSQFVFSIAALTLALPGIALVVIYFTSGVSSLLAILGVAWVVTVGGAILLLGAGWLGAFTQVAYALGARDLSISSNLGPLPEVIGWDPGQTAAGPQRLVSAT